MTRKKHQPTPGRLSSNTSGNMAPNTARRTSADELRDKIGYTLLAVSVGLLGVNYLLPKDRDDSDSDNQRLYGSIAVFWCMVVYGVIKNLIWGKQSGSPAAASTGASGGATTITSAAPAAAALTPPDASNDSTSTANTGASRRTRRA
ncbi:hypothetical protein Agub_g14738 [Astrephomene gubernaculifera]|uniref:Uncharacterized protein n=1 Tax=Astrephomene gubernaculifera TaxID=47775 RepID=A0AAD3E221_9CHLO|nr:hypothetical protein Agub_g14738 [Astrephomene gubernaculifera]